MITVLLLNNTCGSESDYHVLAWSLNNTFMQAVLIKAHWKLCLEFTVGSSYQKRSILKVNVRHDAIQQDFKNWNPLSQSKNMCLLHIWCYIF